MADIGSSSSASSNEEHYESSDKLDTSLTTIGISPLKFQKISKRDSRSYAKRKIHQVLSVLSSHIATAGGFDPDEFETTTLKAKECENCFEYNCLIQELKQKVQISPRRAEKLQILTLAPKSWSIERTASEFMVSTRMVKNARQLKATSGILAKPEKKKGKVLSEETIAKIVNFFEDDEFSRLCPGKKDYVSVRIGGEKIQKQKRLLLSNLKEMYIAYRNKNGSDVGFSKFCELRPKWCVTVGSSGMHSVCVCTIHQNVKLMLAGSIIKEDYKSLMAKTVCDLESKDCMLHRCEKCPGKSALEDFLLEIYSDIDPEETVDFKQWVQTDRTMLETKQMMVEDFLSDLTSKISDLSVHHYISKHQAQYLKDVKETLKECEAIILMDFAENYSFIVQDAVQGFHWENSQATLHPFVIYFRNSSNEIHCLSVCIISDSSRHDTVAVHAFLEKLIPYLKTTLGELKYIRYFSDGSAAQYKNFVNLCYHQIDFGINAEWNFFGTSHGKSPCDGIGGTTKRLAAHASLQRPKDSQILTPQDLFSFCDQNISKIKFIFVSKEEVEDARHDQDERFSEASTVAGTRENHQFIPIDLNQLRVSKVSNDSSSFVAILSQSLFSIATDIQISNIQPGQYVACVYENKWWIGNVCDTSIEEHDALINFMHPHGPARSFYWPDRKDMCWIPEQHFLLILPVPTTTSLGRQYTFPDLIIRSVNEKFLLM